MKPVVVRKADDHTLPVCLEIRRRVFVEEQGVPEALEVDEFDEVHPSDDSDRSNQFDQANQANQANQFDASAVHFIATIEDVPVGTARLRRIDTTTAKVERVAVEAMHRRHGVGSAIMDTLEESARHAGAATVLLAAQVDAINFYARRGYIVEGPEFLDAGIPHRKMRLNLTSGSI